MTIFLGGVGTHLECSPLLGASKNSDLIPYLEEAVFEGIKQDKKMHGPDCRCLFCFKFDKDSAALHIRFKKERSADTTIKH
ncbi:gp094 [Rhodococcus phage ReqiPoco6]|uniref:Gp094 n=1 Tax=Rhodococcus phage ReqiPoco6 TaxID=691964 RepID=D4P7W2_9CAUD|nr:gp094 [Rhodococcus phage ReqiPoco6]ADD81092.1 gp094 [Rhodococcus phage ReqiPoco6]